MHLFDHGKGFNDSSEHSNTGHEEPSFKEEQANSPKESSHQGKSHSLEGIELNEYGDEESKNG